MHGDADWCDGPIVVWFKWFFSGHVTIGGSICMEMLTKSGWRPCNDIEVNIILYSKKFTNKKKSFSHPCPCCPRPPVMDSRASSPCS